MQELSTPFIVTKSATRREVRLKGYLKSTPHEARTRGRLVFTYPRNPPLARCIFMFTLFTAHTSISCTNVYISNLILISARHQTNTDTLLSYFTNAQDHKQLFLLLSE